MRMKWVFLAPLAIFGMLLFVFIGGEVVMHLWNWLLPPLFGFRPIHFWQALGILLLSRILFGGFGFHGTGRSNFRRRVADRIATFGGSWTFIGLFLVTMAGWMAVNQETARGFDPYPFILLNLALSFQAAYAAPVIMMSQNRQQDIDRKEAENDHKINIKAELEIELLHQKIDELREKEGL